MEYIDPQKARQERERQERERQARIKAERERQARIKAEKERQAKLKAERERQARIKAEQEAAKKAQKAEQPELKKPVAQKPENKTPQSEKKPDPKVNSAITWSKPGETTPIHSPSALTYSSISPIHTTITPIAQLPQIDLKPQALLNRTPRTWKNEKADEPKPEPTLKERITAAKIKAIGQQENDQQQKLSTILTDPKSTETQQRTAKVLSARLKAATIEKALPSDQVTLFNLLPNSQTDYRKPLFNQWLDGSKARLGPGEEKGLEQYYTDNSRTLKTLEWIINSAQKPDQPQSQRFKPYLAPTSDPKDKVELIALKNGSLKDLVNKNDPNNKNVWVNGDQIVRAVTKTNAQGKPTTEYFVPKNGSEVHGLNGSSSDPQQQQQKPPTEWVKITPPTEDQKIVSVDATELTQGKQPTTIKSTVNISGAEPQTHKRYNAISARYEDYTNPTFTEYQQLRGDTPRVLTGSNLRNEIGMAMFNSSLGFTPNNAPQPGTPEAELLKQGKWQGDLFNGTTLPEQYKNLPPEQQKQKQEQFKRQQETISKVEEKIKEVGGENAKVTTLPITVDVSDAKTILQLPLFRVTGKDGKDRFVDENGRLYQDMADWKANNKLPPGRVSYFADGRINDAKDQKPNIITENTHAVIDTTGERVKSVADTVLPWLGIAAGAVLIASGLGAPIGAGLIAAATVTMAGVGAYGISQGVGTLNDRATHGQSNTDLTDAEVRGTWLGLTADALSMFAVGSALRLGKGGLSLVDEVGTVGKALSIGAQYADTAAIADSTVSLARNWDRLTPEQQLASIGQIGFWGMSTGVSARQAGGIENLYGAKSIRETFGGRGQTTREGGTPEVNPLNSKTPLQQKTTDLNSLYKDATVAQAELNDVTRLVSQKVGGEPLIPPSLKGRDRTQQKINADYDGDASRITDLARSSIICNNPQQVYKALGELKEQGNVVRVKDRFENPVNGYRDMLVNVEMSNGHIVEVQLHLRSVMEVKNGAGHKLYEESRSIYAKAKMEGRELTPQEQATVTQLEQQQKQLYDDAYQKAVGGVLPEQSDIHSKTFTPGQNGAGFFTEPADKAYELIRESTTDVSSIAQHTGIKASNIQKVKDHLFYQEHLLDRYVDLGIPAEMQRFDSDMAIAKIWRRLENGTYTPNDLQLLRHEAAESYLMRRWGDPSYTRAHDRAQQRFPAPQLNDD